MTGKETFRIPEAIGLPRDVWSAGLGQLREERDMAFAGGLKLGVQYQQIMSDPDRLEALDPESLKELRKVTDILREL